MRSSRKISLALVLGLMLGVFVSSAAWSEEVASTPAPAPEATVAPAPPAAPSDTVATVNNPVSAFSDADATLTSPLAEGQSATTASQKQSGGPFANAPDETSDNTWHYYATGYLWVPGIHGTVGLRGYDTAIHVSSGDIFSNFKGGLLGVFTPSYNRFSFPIDYIWMRLQDSKAIPFMPVEDSGTPASIKATLNMSVVTPKANYLMLNNPKFKIYATGGARIWHVGTTLDLVPTTASYYKGVTWTDFVLGARFSVPVGTKASVDVLGDAGEGGATLDYQVGGIVNYQVKPKISMQAGWRYLTEHYGNNGNVMNTTIQGVLFGATYKFK
jgi:hypothetical protein